MGCAVVLPDDSHAGDVLKRADDAMYRAKQEGATGLPALAARLHGN
jgi:GGDEF domain-containing protein